ncbi:hypothetical protein TRFO_06259 [Tritrichomonas foetus]|uniref:Serine/threonine-protein phosphatase 4 regulatory subunit 3-like central domain-containing protein n=1 Tax=Tritrichomonas foetus TaxID=1144522 RepID=A0A1J4K504_9EUKA|nr:hypothetical protein TRFO_06259 [Tritrichomonas foetus]|eukprot:OHT04796.1 hypothetical protein TRFO_06259 [Tritrichomonas foetus]
MIVYKHKLNNTGDFHQLKLLLIKDNENDNEQTTDYVIPIKFEDFRIEYVKESLSMLFDSNIAKQNEGLDSITQLVYLNHEEVFNMFTIDIINLVTLMTLQNNTATNAYRLLGMITFFTNDFSCYISKIEFYTNICNNILCFSEQQIRYCIILLINLFDFVPINDIIQTGIFDLLLEIPNPIQIPKAIDLFSVIILRNDLPDEIFRNYLLFFKKTILIRNLSQKIIKIIFDVFERLLYASNHSFEVQDIIRNNAIIMKLIQQINYNRDECCCCLRILRYMIYKDDAFFPQLTVFDFDKLLTRMILSSNEEVRYETILICQVYLKIFPDFHKYFIDFNFDQYFFSSNYKIKEMLFSFYEVILTQIEEACKLFLTEELFVESLEMLSNVSEEVKLKIYQFLFCLVRKKSILNFNPYELTMNSNSAVETVENDIISGNPEILRCSRLFKRLILQGHDTDVPKEDNENEEN